MYRRLAAASSRSPRRRVRPARRIGPVLPGASDVGDGGEATLSPGVPETRDGDADDPATGDPTAWPVAAGDPASVTAGERGSGEWLSTGVGLAAALVPTTVA